MTSIRAPDSTTYTVVWVEGARQLEQSPCLPDMPRLQLGHRILRLMLNFVYNETFEKSSVYFVIFIELLVKCWKCG